MAHRRFGEGHAEVNALDKIEDNKDLSRRHSVRHA